MPREVTNEVREFLGIGVYSLSEAGRILGRSFGTIRRWTQEYTFKARFGHQTIGPAVMLQKRGDDRYEFISYSELIELYLVGKLRDQGVPLREIHQAAGRLREEYSILHPFASKKVLVSENHLLYQDVLGNLLTPDGRQSTMSFARKFAKKLVFREDEAIQYWPLGPSKSVVLDPTRHFGAPIDAKSGITTASIFHSYKAEREDVDVVSFWLDIPKTRVLQAVEFERKLAA